MQVQHKTKRVQKVVFKHMLRKFKIGENDCCTFAAEVAEALTGQNPYELFGLEYWDMESAEKALKRYGKKATFNDNFVFMVKKLGKAVGLKVVPNLRANDIFVMTDDNNEASFGVCMGSHCVGMSKTGLKKISPSTDNILIIMRG